MLVTYLVEEKALKQGFALSQQVFFLIVKQ